MHIQSASSPSSHFCGLSILPAKPVSGKEIKPSQTQSAQYRFIFPWMIKKEITLNTREGEKINAKILCPKKGTWIVICENAECAGVMWFHRGRAHIKGIPDEYKNKEYLFINKLDARYDKYKGVGTTLVQSLIEESRKMGLGGRVCLNATATDPKQGSPVGFYHSIGLKSTDADYEIELSNYPNGKIPKDARSTTMYFPT